MNSNRKGKEGERELANLLKDRYGYDCRRGQQFCGSNGDADVVGLPGIHIECKRVEKLNIYEAVEQSINDAREGEIPTVMHRKNHKPWLVTLPFENFIEMQYSVEMDGKSDGQSKLTVLTALALRSGNLVEITLTGQILAVRYLTARSHLQKLHRRELQTASRNTLSMLSLLIS